ncbi:MAG: PqqD family protein [Congregibacter sp.]
MSVILDEDSILIPNTQWTAMYVEDELVLFDEDQQQTMYLNPTASLVWRLLDGSRSCGELRELLTEAYDDPEPIEIQVLQVCQQMLDDSIALVIE